MKDNNDNQKKAFKYQLIFLGIMAVLIFGIMWAEHSIQNYQIQKHSGCTYDRNIQIQKARFDLANAFYNYPYNKFQTDMNYAYQYANCS